MTKLINDVINIAINKEPISFQNLFAVLSRLGQGKS